MRHESSTKGRQSPTGGKHKTAEQTPWGNVMKTDDPSEDQSASHRRADSETTTDRENTEKQHINQHPANPRPLAARIPASYDLPATAPKRRLEEHMDFNDTPDEAAWRREVRGFLEKEHPAEMRRAGGGRGASAEEGGLFRSGNEGEPMKRWRSALSSRGWVAPAWPKEYGGAGLDTKKQFIMNEEFAEFGASNVGGFGVMMFGPTLIVHGSEDQKKEHLPGILSGDVQWCQGWSEPNAGSDVASVQTRAIRDGDDYVVNGQKIWTTGAQYADMMYMLARTDPEAPKHRGISYFMLDMKAPGVTVRPLVTMAGSATFNEVFFENVRVPVRNRLGEENRGWYIGTTTLDFERSSIGSAVGIRKQLESIIRFVKDHPKLAVGARKHETKTALAD